MRSLLCLTLAGAFLPVFSATPDSVRKMVQIKHKTEKFSVSLPSNWMVHRDVVMKGYKISLAAIRPAAKGEVFRENVLVVAEKISSGMTAEEYMKESQKGLSGTLKEFKALDSGLLENGQAPAAYLVYTHKMMMDLKVIIFFFPKGNKGYTVSCSATPESFDNYQDLFMAIGRSFTP